MISDDMIHGSWAGKRRRTRKRLAGERGVDASRRSAGVKLTCETTGSASRGSRVWIELETSIVPRAIAEAVHEETSVWLKTALPRQWIEELCDRAETLYRRNPQFQRCVRQGGDRGRDQLWAFMRHWLAARVRAWDSNLFALLPASYAIGAKLSSRGPPRARGPGETLQSVHSAELLCSGSNPVAGHEPFRSGPGRPRVLAIPVSAGAPAAGGISS